MTKPADRIRVVVTEDSAVTRALMTAILEEASGFELVGAFRTGFLEGGDACELQR